MNELLRYSLFNIAYTILLFELLAIGICFTVISGIKFYFIIKNRFDEFIQCRLSHLIARSVGDKQPALSIPLYLQGFRNLLKAVNSVDMRIVDQSWTELRDFLIQTYLIKQARKWFSSRFWTRRFFAAQCILLNPRIAKKEELSSLLNDSKLLIRIIAVRAIIKIDDRQLFEQVIHRISKEEKLSRFYYRDPLIKADEKKFVWLIEILKKSTDTALSSVCLDLLSSRTVNNVFASVLPFIYGSDRECRLLAIKVLKNIPSEEASDALFQCLEDGDWEVRVEALKALSPDRFLVQKGLLRVEHMLHDPVWAVRLQAALALKELGDRGLQILSKFNPEKEPESYEISRYVLGLPEA